MNQKAIREKLKSAFLFHAEGHIKKHLANVEVLLSNQICDDDIVTPVSTLNLFNSFRRIEKDHEEDWRKKNKPARNYHGSFIEEFYLWINQFQNYLRRLLINEFNNIILKTNLL